MGARKFTIEEVRDVCLEKGFILTDIEYKNCDTPLKMICPNGHCIKLRFDHLKRGIGCVICFNENKRGSSTRLTIENIKNKLKSIEEKDVLISSEYKNNLEKLCFKCFICKEKYWISWDCFYNKKCRHDSCSKKRGRGKQLEFLITGEYNLLALYPEISSEWDYNKNENSPERYSPHSGQFIWWICKKCDFSWKSKISNRVNCENGCPNCKSVSRGEKKIYEELINLGIDSEKIKTQIRFDDCKLKKALPFDLGIMLENNFWILIEYMGIQHYEVSYDKFFGNEDDLKERQYRDSIKFNWCKENNIPLIIIPYWEFKNIKNILLEELSL